MAQQLGLARRWCQHEGTNEEHYDISLSKRALALRLGARAVSSRELVRLRQAKRNRPMEAS